MIPRAISVAAVAPVLAGAALLFTAGAASAATQSFTAVLSSANEAGGAAGLTGTATLTVNTTTGVVCAKVTSNVTGAVAIHIHKGASGVSGAVVVPLDAKSINGASICKTATPAVAAAIAANSAGYYVNIHTPAKPAGALRGQLAASATPSGVNAGSGGQAGTSQDTTGAFVALMVVGAGLAGAAGWRLVRR